MRLRHCLYVLASILGLMMPPSPLAARGERQPLDAAPASGREKGDLTSGEEAARRVAPAPVPTPLQLVNRDKLYEAAYMDAYSILSADNQCSRFYGGSSIAVTVFNQLIGQLRPDYDSDYKVGISMLAPVNFIQDQKTGYEYRLFAAAKVNLNGPFYKGQAASLDRHMPNIGHFQANTREARVLLLLHELGHLVKGQDKSWLLPDDGDDPFLSARNTRKVEAQCSKQIRELAGRVTGINTLAGTETGPGAQVSAAVEPLPAQP